MNKKKNKNKQNKPPNPIPPQKREEFTEPLTSPEKVIESVTEDRVPNIVSENVPVEVKEFDGTPKKPKRNRGKKKKEDEKSDKEDDVKVEDSKPAQVVEDELSDINIAPTARKKKNKNKKIQEPVQEEKSVDKEQLSEIKDEKHDESQEVKIQKLDEIEAETKSCKKKNKKKKNRNDSEKSDKEEASCISAFQQLLVEDKKSNDNVTKPSADVDVISDSSVKELEVSSQAIIPADIKTEEESSSKEDVHKNKKKNKKDKKHPPTDLKSTISEDTDHHKLSKSNETVTPHGSVELPFQASPKDITESLPVEESSLDAASIEQKSPKLKAKIAKPVEKKKKENSDAEKCLEENAESVVEEKTTEKESFPFETLAKSEVVPTVALDDFDLKTKISPNWYEEVKSSDSSVPDAGSKAINETSIQLKSTENEKNKKRKKSPKPLKINDMPETFDKSNESMPEISKTDIIKTTEDICSSVGNIKSKGDVPLEVKSELQPLDKKLEPTKATTEIERKQKGKKSPKPQRKNECTTPEILTNVALETIKIDETKTVDTDIIDKAKDETEQLPVQNLVPDVEKAAIKDEIMHIQSPDHEKCQKRKKSPKPSINIEMASGSKGNATKNVINIDDIIIIQAEVVSDENAPKADTFVATQESNKSKDDIQNTEVKPDREKSKKGKKFAKQTKKEMATEFEIVIDQTDKRDTHPEIKIPVTPQPTDTKFSPDALSVELEVPKVEPSLNDVTPDLIEYPRCSSEKLLDSNNNTVIHEMSNVETKLEIPIVLPDTPFIRDTDLLIPEATFSEIEVKNFEPTPKPADEKTDIKSKVMEVNQDMEELRLSIERSLAELTSLDKKGSEIEKKMEETSHKNVTKTDNQDVVPVLSTVEQVPDCIKAEAPAETKKTCLEDISIASKEPVCPERKDRKGKGKSKKGKQEVPHISSTQSTNTNTSTTTDGKELAQSKDDKKEESNKSEQKTDQDKGKQQSSGTKENRDNDSNVCSFPEGSTEPDFEHIENFEDAMTSSVEDVNKTFEIIANEGNSRLDVSQNNPEINIIAPQDDDKGKKQEKQDPVSPPKNLLGHPDIPVPSSRTDYKKEKNRTPNYRQAKVKIKDVNEDQIESPEKLKQSKESQTENKRKDESICVTNKNEDYIYKYSFRKVFLQCACHVCKKDLMQSRVPCSFCNLIFYCSQKHKDEDYAQHQALCFAVSTIVHLKDQKFIYAVARNITGHNYRLLRMQMIVSSEKVLKRRLVPWEQEALLYPRICADAGCREWRQLNLKDCEGCGQISYCSDHPEHLPKTHTRWCKSYNLYRSLVRHQQTQGRLEPKLPTRVVDLTPLPDNINEVLASMYEERIDMSDIEYAALTQLATAPLTALHCLQAYKLSIANGVAKKSTLTLHIVGAELQFEADVLNKWEVFLLHLVPQVKELRVVLVGPDLNPSNLPLELLGKIKLCENCQQNKRRVVFNFQDKRTYHEFWASEDFTTPDLVCAFNPSIQRSSTYNGRDSWPSTIKCILKLKVPFAITSYTLSELAGDLLMVQECAAHSIISSPKNNSFASVRPDRNFISDDEAPLLFKNHCVAVVCGV